MMMTTTQSGAGWRSIPVDDLPLSVRAHNGLQRADIASLGELVRKTPKDLLAIQHMGTKSVSEIEAVLTERGLRLGMPDSTPPTDDLPAADGACAAVEAFVRAMVLVRCHGVGSVAELVAKNPQEVATLPGVDSAVLRCLTEGLDKWGLALGVSVGGTGGNGGDVRDVDDRQPTDSAAGKQRIRCEDAKNVREELLYVVSRLRMERRGEARARCFVAHHGIDGRPKRTLQWIAERGTEHGFDGAVTRERVRQVVDAAERTLRKEGSWIEFTRWASAVREAQARAPVTLDGFVTLFGYQSCEEPSGVFRFLVRAAEIFSLEFPFDMRMVRDSIFVAGRAADGGDDEATDVLGRLKTIKPDGYHETEATAKAIECDVAVLERVIAGPCGWDFLDEERRYFWKIPGLPPNNYAMTRNTILTGLCRVFSVAGDVASVDLASAIGRYRGVRRSIPREVIEGVAARSGLFDVEDGIVRKNTGQEWFSVGRRDLSLLRVCAQHGRVISSRTLHSSLVRSGLTRENAGAIVVSSPFLVHSKSGVGHQEGIYKFVCRPEDVDIAALEARLKAGNGEDESVSETVTADEVDDAASVRIAVSPRLRLTGSHFGAEPFGPDGEWRVCDLDGNVIGGITVHGQLIEGLKPVIEALGLGPTDTLELKWQRDGDVVAIRS